MITEHSHSLKLANQSRQLNFARLLAPLIIFSMQTKRDLSSRQLYNMAPVTSVRMPAWFLTHGGGPMPLLKPEDPRSSGIVSSIKTLASDLKTKPQAILLISGHYEEDIPTVVTAAKPGMLYDYSNFPPEAYKIQYPAPGSPALAANVQALLRDAGIATATDAKRGYDHGVFVPLLIGFPEADIPVVQLSMVSSLDPKEHVKIGNALAPLRDQGVLIIGSGASFHNIQSMRLGSAQERISKSKEFDDWLQETLSKADLDPEEREMRFADWAQAPHAKFCHPREEHLIPAHVCLGSALGSRAEVVFSGSAMGAACSSYAWS